MLIVVKLPTKMSIKPHFTTNDQMICFEEAEKAFVAIEEAQRIASIQARVEVLKGLKGE